MISKQDWTRISVFCLDQVRPRLASISGKPLVTLPKELKLFIASSSKNWTRIGIKDKHIRRGSSMSYQ